MVRGCAILSQALLLYVVRDTWGLRCYVGALGQPKSRIVRGGKYCGVVFELPCEGKGFYDQFNADFEQPWCTPTEHALACYCNTNLCNMNISAIREIWKSSPDYSTEESYPECFRNPFPEDRSLQSTTTTTQRMTTTKEGKLGPLLPDMKKTRKPGTVEDHTKDAFKKDEGSEKGKNSGQIPRLHCSCFVIFYMYIVWLLYF
ncbi:hypothetical protein RB195_016080 [Necator americanus]|uniref:Uncharacterized protein n=1 Tax=Necator americanus TaxID=51031 RepID=A0ABR1E7H1_NECAM